MAQKKFLQAADLAKNRNNQVCKRFIQRIAALVARCRPASHSCPAYTDGAQSSKPCTAGITTVYLLSQMPSVATRSVAREPRNTACPLSNLFFFNFFIFKKKESAAICPHPAVAYADVLARRCATPGLAHPRSDPRAGLYS